MIIKQILEINSYTVDGKRVYDVTFIDDNGLKQIKKMDNIECLEGKEWTEE